MAPPFFSFAETSTFAVHRIESPYVTCLCVSKPVIPAARLVVQVGAEGVLAKARARDDEAADCGS